MEEDMAVDLASMRKARNEAIDREMACDSTSYHGFESTSTYQEGLPYGNYVEENQYCYGERHQSWNMEYGYEEANGYQEAYGYDQGVYNYEDVYSYEGGYYNQEAYGYEEASPSPSNDYEEIRNMLKLLIDVYRPAGYCNTTLNKMDPYDYEEASLSPSNEKEEIHNLVIEGPESYCNTTLNKMDAIEDALEKFSRDASNIGKIVDEGLLNNDHEDNLIVTPSTSPKVEEDLEMTKAMDGTLEEFEAWITTLYVEKEVVNDQEKNLVEFKVEDPSSFTLPYAIEEKEHKLLSWDEIEEFLRTSDLEDNETQLKDWETNASAIKESKEVGKDVIEKFPLSAPKERLECVSIEGTSCLEDENILLAFEEESPKAKPFLKHHGLNLTIPLGVNDHWKLPLFEEVRMKEFRGWFYDEYDPGDPCRLITPFLKRVKGVCSRDAFVEKNPLSDLITV